MLVILLLMLFRGWKIRLKMEVVQAPYLESWRTRVYYTGRPRGVNTASSEPQTKGLQSFIHRQAWLSGFVGLKGLSNCTEQDKGEWDKLQFLLLWVLTFRVLCDPDFARSKLSYRGRRSRRSCKILTFPLHFNHWNWSSWEKVGIKQEEKILWSTD